MLKKNKLPILLLAVVVMLSIFYIKQPGNDTDTPVGGDGTITDTRYAEFAEERLALLQKRTENIATLEATIAAGSLSSSEIADVVSQINMIYNVQYTEVELENAIMAMGYDDALVCVIGTDINIDILTNEFTTSDFVSVALAAKEKFNKSYAVKISVVNNE